MKSKTIVDNKLKNKPKANFRFNDVPNIHAGCEFGLRGGAASQY
jgi:hypothetical protein